MNKAKRKPKGKSISSRFRSSRDAKAEADRITELAMANAAIAQQVTLVTRKGPLQRMLQDAFHADAELDLCCGGVEGVTAFVRSSAVEMLTGIVTFDVELKTIYTQPSKS